MKKWTIEDSKELYNINGWGTSYFGINDEGNVYVTPCKDGTQIDLREVMDELSLRDVTSPVLLRFPDILDNRIEKTWSCFKKAAEEYEYKAENYVVFPIKVNQMQPVVEEIISHGRKFNLGIEAGSKPELHAVIAVQCQSDSIIICNGYKDQSYIELALLAQKMGKRIFIVVEKLNELEIIAREAKKLGVRPNIGIRIKLASSGSGKWEESGGDASKFGLTSAELLEALDLLDKKDMRDCLRLIHFHIGSQITKIRRIQTALREASQFYVHLHKMGYNVDASGKLTVMICSGDSGIYGMASPVLELASEYGVEVEVIPGVTAAASGAALLGSPITCDFAVISLSDLLTPMERIEKRLEGAAMADLCIVLYNPSSRKRADYLMRACDIVLKYRSPETVCGIARNIGREGESSTVLTLAELRETAADMFTTVFIGNSETKVIDGHMVTPRGYRNE